MRILLSNIGGEIKKRREVLNLLQSQLADVSGISVRTIQLIELGKANPSLTTLLKIINPLGLTVSLKIKEPGEDIKI